ncbi:T9SS type A sorting domain-containing protein [Fibrobacter sp. UWB12]|uniref:T9SS type A sorting domain-containing protein n=1 Tax=Fibrobacter sp. UWB12 TaxID=1896203 RepID=UPI00352D4211
MLWFIYSSKNGEDIVRRNVDDSTVYIWGKKILGLSKSKMTHALTGDYDGDGINDIGAVECFDDAKPYPYCIWKYLSSEEGKVKGIPIMESNEGMWGRMTSYQTVVEGDLDADGKSDPTIWDPTLGWFSISSRTGKALYDPNLGSHDYMGYQVFVMKNSDCDQIGNCRLVALEAMEQDTIDKYVNDGWIFEPVVGATVFEYRWGDALHKPLVGDFNGDGMGDMSLVNMMNFNWQVNVSPPASVGYFRDVLTYFKKIANPQFFVGDFDGDGVSDCAMGDAQNARVYFYTSSFKDKPIEKTISPLYNPFMGALYKAQFVPTPSVDVEKPQIAPVLTKSPMFKTQGLTLTISDMEMGSDVSVFNMIGQNIIKEKADFAEKKIQLPTKGMYIVRVGNHSSVINVK